jgi:predicted phage tail component-like protein
MATKLHRAKGFTFNNVVVNNTDNIFLLDVKRNATPIKTRYDFIVPKRNGSTTFPNRYENQYIDVVIGIYDVDIITRRTKQRTLLQNMIDVNSQLIFLDEPTLFYNAEVIDAIEVSEGEVFTEITIHFKCSFCKYGTEKNITLVAGTNTITNSGNYSADAIIEVTALTNSTSIVIGNGTYSFTLSSILAGEVIYIDSAKMIVYKIVNGVKQSVLTRFTGQFFQLSKGNNTITLSGISYSATVKIKFNDTYIV